jgi:hypothetical protein
LTLAADARAKTVPYYVEEASPEDVAAPPAQETPVAAEEPTAGPAPDALQFGGAFRSRWVTLPHWFLDTFTKSNQAISSYAVAFEGFRRKRDPDNPNRFWEVSLALGYQKMSAPDGNWLAKNHDAAIDTDWVQLKNTAFWTIDLAFLQRQYFNQVFGIHYGAGWGLAIIQGDVLRTKSYGCTDKNLDTCRPKVCTKPGGGCTEAELQPTQTGQKSTVDDPHRYKEGSVPGAVLIVNLVAGFDFRIPQTKGLEFRLEGGFYDAFFIGGAVAYSH